MVANDNKSKKPAAIAPADAEGLPDNRARIERELLQTKDALEHKIAELSKSEALHRSALKAGRLVHWETDIAARTRTWQEESMALFGLTLADCRGQFGGENDEFRLALHPDDRHLVKAFYELADKQDWFPAEYRIVKPDGAIRWLSGGGQVVARDGDGKATRLVNVVADITDRKVSEEHIHFVMREMTHRAKNLLAVVQAMAQQTGRTAHTYDEFQKRFGQRLQGLAASHDILVLQDWQGAPLTDLVRDQLAPFVETARIDVSGPDILISPKAAEAIGLALHELATNAVKYGALSNSSGRITISWGFENQGTAAQELRLSWVERGGPAITPPSHKGFGYRVFERFVTHALNGKMTMNFPPDGLNWNLVVPTANLMAE
jgi:PAS domain S-box-containing protein